MPTRIQYPPNDEICAFIKDNQINSPDGYVRFGDIANHFAAYKIKDFSFLRKLKELVIDGVIIHAERIGYRVSAPLLPGQHDVHEIGLVVDRDEDRREECWGNNKIQEDLLRSLKEHTNIQIEHPQEWYLSNKFHQDFQTLIERILVHCIYNNPDLYQTFKKSQDMHFGIHIHADWDKDPEIFQKWEKVKNQALEQGSIELLIPNSHSLFDPNNEEEEKQKAIDQLSESHLFNRAFTEATFRSNQINQNKQELENRRMIALNLCQQEVWENFFAQHQADEQMLAQLQALNELKLKIEQKQIYIPKGTPKIALLQELSGNWKAIITTQEEDIWNRYIKQYRRKFQQYLLDQREKSGDPFYSIELARKNYSKIDPPKTYKEILREWEELQKVKPSRTIKETQRAIEIRPWNINKNEQLDEESEDMDNQPNIQTWSFWDQRTMEKIFAQQRALVEKIAEEAEKEPEIENTKKSPSFLTNKELGKNIKKKQ